MTTRRMLLSVGCIVVMLSVRTALGDNLLQGLAAYWKLNETGWSGAEGEVRDSSGNCEHATTISNVVATSDGKLNGAALLDGDSGTYIKLPNGLLGHQDQTGMTLSSWVKFASGSANYAPIVGLRPYDGYSYAASGGIGRSTNGLAYISVFSPGVDYFFCDGTNVLTADEWHLIVGTYTPADTKLRIYVDGVRQNELTIPTFVTGSGANYIGHDNQGGYNGTIDEVGLWSRPLSDQEVSSLWNNGQGLDIRVHVEAALLTRTTFYRDETNAMLSLRISNLEPTGEMVQVDCAIGNLFTNHQAFTATSSSEIVSFPFSPSLLNRSNHVCQATVTIGEETEVFDLSMTVAPALRRDLYMLSPWTSGNISDQEMTFYRTLGLNHFMSGAISDEDMNLLGSLGMLYHSSWYVEGSFAPANRPALAAQARQLAEALAPFPNWTGADINDEHGGLTFPDEAERAAWFDDWARYEADPPFYPLVTNGYWLPTCNNPEMTVFPDGEQPAPDGVYDPPPLSFQFLDWWENYAIWQVNAFVASEIKAVRPDVTVWTEPVAHPGQVLDAAGMWSYSPNPATIIGELALGYANCRAVGKPFYAVLGMDYVSGPIVATSPGVTNSLTVTPDDLIQQSWLASQVIPSEGLIYWMWQEWFHGLRGEPCSGLDFPPYCASNTATALGAALTNDILPAATMLKGVPNAQRAVALLLPESTTWFASVPLNHIWVTHWYTRTVWFPCLAAMQIPYDVVKDADLTPGSLAQYKAVIFPMGIYASAFTSNQLAIAGASGTRIIVDAYGAQTNYPNMERWPQENYWTMADPSGFSAELANTMERVAELAADLRPDVDYAVGESGPLFTSVRESEGVKYMAVINNCRTNGDYTTWTGDPTFQPYGRQQQATVHLKAPAGIAVYEFTQSQKLTTTYQDGHHVATVTLPPHAGRLLCVYPAALDHLEVTTPLDGAVLGVTTTVSVAVIDATQATAPGRQLVEVRVFDAQNNLHDESGLYCVRDGQALIPFRPALNEAAGSWRVEVRERTSGLTATNVVPVTAALPAVALTSPANGALFTAPATVTVAANASDSGGSIAHVEFYRDSTLIANDTTEPYTCSWTNVAAGTYTQRAKAYDNDGASTVSGVASITVNDVPSPTVTAPTDGAAYLLPSSVAWTVTVTNMIGVMTNVSFYANGAFCATGRMVSATVFTNLWTPAAGRYALTAKGWDSYGAGGTSTVSASVLVWTNAHIGANSGDTAATYSDPIYTVNGKGAGITGTADAFRFLYLSVTGDCSIVARVTNVVGSVAANTRLGVMMRASTNANAIEASALYYPLSSSRMVYFHRRTSTGGSTSTNSTAAAAAPYWVKLSRSNNVMRAFVSTNGTSWIQVGSNTIVTLGNPVLVGVAVTSGSTSSLVTGRFDNVSIGAP